VSDEDVRVGSPARSAAGLPGVVHGLSHVVRHAGIRRGAAALRILNQDGGVDCPGCAWPEPHDRSTFEFCENGAKAVADDATRDTVDAAFFARHPVADLDRRTDHWLNAQGRLVEPMHLAPGADRYAPISWDAALRRVADALRATTPERAVFYTSGRASNEAAFVFQLLARSIGTNNLPDCSNMCHESSGVALTETIGIGKGTVLLDDFAAAELIVVMGQNPGTNHPRMLTALEDAKRAGATIVAVNPLPEAGLLRFRNPQRPSGIVGAGTALADLHVPVTLGGDLPLLQFVNRHLVTSELVDHEFVAAHGEGYEPLADHLRALDPVTLAVAAGVDARAAQALADLVGRAERIVVCWAMGLTQHRDAVATIREIVNLLLLRGSIGKPGAGACPVRGHSNVQGDRTMGITERPSDGFLDRLDAATGITSPRHHGVDTVRTIEAMAAGDVDVFVSLGGNFAAATPDSAATRTALARCGLTVQVSTKLNRSHVVTGVEALILPVISRTDRDQTGGREQFVTVEDSMGMVHRSAGRLDPPGARLRSEVDVLTSIGELVGELPGGRSGTGVTWASLRADYASIRSLVEQVVDGFDDFDARVRRPGGFVLPNGPRDALRFDTPTDRAKLTVNVASPDPDRPAGTLVMQTLRSHDQYNTTVYGLDDRYRGIRGGRRVVFCNDDDLAALGIANGEMVDIETVWSDGVERRAPGFRVVAYPTPQGTCATYFPEANVLVPLGSVATGSNTPTSKYVVVRLTPRSP
jgi:molybdopterin-dependent oxidoreductase alpha subunit